MTVRVDSKQKQIFDQLCSEFGMSANTAMNIFVNAVVRSRRIPFEISAPQENEPVDGQGQFPEMALDEINEEIRLAREEADKRK